MKKALLSGLVVSSVVLGANVALGAVLEIDHFTQPFDVNPNTGEQGLYVSDSSGILTDSQEQTGLSSVLGGTRDTTLDILNTAGSVATDTLLQISTSGTGLLDQSVSGDGNRTTMTMTWDGGGAGLGADLSAFDRFRLKVSNFDLNAGTTTTNIGTISLRTRSSSSAPYANVSQTLNVISTETPIDFLFSSFSGVSFNSIYDIQLQVEGSQPGLLFTFDDLQAYSDPTPPGTPEPSLALGCLLLGGTQFAITGWKRYKNARKN